MTLGFIFFGIGAVGAFLPMLPTTPFLLVSGFFFAKSSKKMTSWFKSTKLYKTYLNGCTNKEGMTLKVKLHILSMVTVLLIIAAYFMRNTSFGLVVLGVLWLGHAIAFIFFIKTKK